MKQFSAAVALRIYITETDKHRGRPLYEQIVMQAHELHLAGATVTRGMVGFGAHNYIHANKLLTLSEDMPVVITIVDVKENVLKIVPFLDEVVTEGMVTMEPIQVKMIRLHEKQSALS